ncbi:proteasome inhibitor PI31 subunit [Anthonomus grandis grandis]|uniref:proteasome inhibitor PI31 subunit n=1 Tax=Anthonomus grandis grandis TaxID=2921223 RepID=UPI002165A154|nr:proteasome inhibitor PI31 subunit [Anthonomus grandis grandis]
MATSLFGWDLLYGSVQNDIKNNRDILVCLTHLVLVSNGFKCIGLGESKTIDGTEPKSETLPKGWNDDYTIRYLYQGRLYNLNATSLDDGVIINLIRIDERTVSSVQFNLRQVAQKTGTLEEIIPDYKSLVDRIKEDLIDKVVVSTKSKNVSSQTDPPASRSNVPDPLYEPPRVPGGSAPISPVQPLNPYDYGRSDLDPFGIDPLRVGPRIGPGLGGGGMLFQPPTGLPGPGTNPGIAPGSLPPGARFDPFRPPEGLPRPRGPQRPDNDDFPPPGYDDMFM